MMASSVIPITPLHVKQKQWESRWSEQLDKALEADKEPWLTEIIPASRQKIDKMVWTIRSFYKDRKPRDALDYYLGFVRRHALDVDLKRIEEFQKEDMVRAILNKEVVWLRSRRGGKTRDLSLITVFWCIVDRDPIWFTPEKDQQKQAIKYFLANPFVERIVKDYVYVYSCKESIEISNLTKGKAASKGKNCIVYDEGAKVQKGLAIYDFYQFSRAIIAGKLWRGDTHILSASTAARNTAIEEEYNKMQRLDADMVSVHPYTDCWWISDEWVEEERQANLNDPWFIDQEYMTMFVNRGGSIFENLVFDERHTEWGEMNCTHIGNDINQDDAVIFLHITDNRITNKRHIYILGEKTYDWAADEDCYNDIKPQATILIGTKFIRLDMNYSFEIEGMGYNEKESRWIHNHIANVILNMDWGEDMKGDRVAFAKSAIIHVDPLLTPMIYQDLRNATYHAYKKGYLKDKGHPCHWLDSFLHACCANVGKFIDHKRYNKTVLDLPQHLIKKYRR